MSVFLILALLAVTSLVIAAVVVHHRRSIARVPRGPVFSNDVRMTMDVAVQEARTLGHAYVGPEHILLALTSTGSSEWWSSLTPTGLDAASVRRDMLARLATSRHEGTCEVTREVTALTLPYTARAYHALRRAVTLAAARHQSTTSAHELTMGLVRDDQSNAAQVLRHHGLRYSA